MSECFYCHAQFEGRSVFCCSSCELLSNWQTKGIAPLQNSVEVSAKWQKFGLQKLESIYNFSVCPLYKKFKFYVDGLQCSSCVHLLEDFPKYAHGIHEGRVDYARHTFEVQAQSQISLAQVCQWIENLGYSPTPIKEASDYEKAKSIENREDLKRIGVAGAVAGNLMLFAVPIYAGLDGNLAFIFKWLSFFIFLPLLLYSARPFFKNAWVSLLVRRVNVDMMIVAALVAGFLFSTYSLILNHDEIYFDSTASFIFLILLTRYILKKYQDLLLKKNILEDLFGTELYEVCIEFEKQMLSFAELKAGDLINLQPTQTVPCDSLLQTESQLFDLSFLTGEAYPQLKHRGERVLAGSRLVQGQALLECLEIAANSELSRNLEKLESAQNTKSDIQSLSDLFSHRLTLSVFAIVGLFFILTYPSLGIEAFKRCLALITIACPCAIAFGAPLAHGLGMKKAVQNGFFIRSGQVFEKLSQVRKILFDKTGTLTSSDLKLVQTFPADIPNQQKSIILGLEKASLHPVALSLRKAWKHFEVLNLKQVEEVAGSGVWASHDGHIYRLSKPDTIPQNEMLQVDFSKDGKAAAYLYFSEQVAAEASKVVRKFREDEFEVMMLTGDSRGRAIDVAKVVGIRPAHIFSEQSPDSKKEIISQQNPCLYVGDGLNDLQALQEAYVSFAVRGPFEATMQVSDVYAPQKNLNALLEIVELSRKIHGILKVNLMFAILYNAAGGILALLGLINPLVAAVLMPISSLLITLHTVWRLK